MKNIDSLAHLRGESEFVDDIPVREGCLHAAVLASKIARGEFLSLDLSAARSAPGVIAVWKLPLLSRTYWQIELGWNIRPETLLRVKS